MTEEMKEIINSKNKHIVVQAFAGVGKTSTMLDYVRLHPHEKILFLVYNKEMSLDFSKRLKGISHNCDVKTIHSLAYGWFRKNFVTRQLRNINIIDIEKIVSIDLSYPQLSKIKFYLDMYLTSDLEDVKDLKVIDKEDKSLLFYVKKVWLYLVNSSDFIPHNVYLKLFQLAKVKLNYDTILQDECLDGDMFVKTDKGLRRIKHIHRDVQEGKTINVLSYNHETETFEYKKVTGSKETKNRDIYWLKTEGLNSLYCTENHRILTQRGYVRLDEIVVGKDQIILDTPTNQKTKVKLNDDQYQLVLGSYLGDGCLRSRSKNKFPTYHLSFTQGVNQLNYFRMKKDCMNIKSERVIKSGYTGSRNIYSSGMSTTFALDNFVENSLYDMDERALSIWFMDDGTTKKVLNKNSTTYFASIDLGNKSDRIANIIMDILVHKFNFDEKYIKLVKYKQGEYKYIRFNKQGSEHLYSLISRYIHTDLLYKIPKDYIPKEQYVWDNKFKYYGSNFVKNITYKKKGSVYDISVEDNHNFVTCYSYVHNGVIPTGIVVHNCNDINKCMLSILTNNLDKKIIAVGDSYQMINAFNFNCDGLSILRDEYKFKQYNLTNSFRVSNKIADISSRYLSYMYKDNLKFIGLGRTKIKKLDLYNATKDNQIHLLCRTRLGGLKQVADILDKDDSKKIYYVGGLDGFGLKEVERILSYKGKVYIGGKLFHINQLRQMLKEGVDDPEISRICSIYTFGEKNSDLIDLIKRTEVKDRKEADIVVLTSHSSKGLTLKNGVLGNDFPSVEQIRKEMYKPNLHEYVQRCINSECNLLYVAITRFTDYVDIGQTFNRDDKIDKSKKLTEVLDYK